MLHRCWWGWQGKPAGSRWREGGGKMSTHDSSLEEGKRSVGQMLIIQSLRIIWGSTWNLRMDPPTTPVSSAWRFITSASWFTNTCNKESLNGDCHSLSTWWKRLWWMLVIVMVVVNTCWKSTSSRPVRRTRRSQEKDTAISSPVLDHKVQAQENPLISTPGAFFHHCPSHGAPCWHPSTGQARVNFVAVCGRILATNSTPSCPCSLLFQPAEC